MQAWTPAFAGVTNVKELRRTTLARRRNTFPHPVMSAKRLRECEACYFSKL